MKRNKQEKRDGGVLEMKGKRGKEAELITIKKTKCDQI